MFGLEGDKKSKKKTEEFVFELEKDLKSLGKHQEYKKKVDSRIQQIKELLRSGESKADFDTLGILLHGYTSLLKVMSRFSPK
jgi:hypothetical protein